MRRRDLKHAREENWNRAVKLVVKKRRGIFESDDESSSSEDSDKTIHPKKLERLFGLEPKGKEKGKMSDLNEVYHDVSERTSMDDAIKEAAKLFVQVAC